MAVRSGSETLTPVTPARPHRRLDLVLGVVLGIVLGIAVISAFVFLGSEAAIDAPRIKGVDTGKAAQPARLAPRAAGAESQRP